jgi:hypothetical protein
VADTKSDRRAMAALIWGSKTWSAEAGSKYSIRQGKSAQFDPLVSIKTPNSEPLRLEGNIDIRYDKMLRSDLTLTMPDWLDIPVSVKCEFSVYKNISNKSNF